MQKMQKMQRTRLLAAAACLAAGLAQAEEAPATDAPKALSGMSVLGNSEAPKSLVIVPWKTSELGDGLGLASLLDDRARPVDKEVFARELAFFELRTGPVMGDAGQQARGSERAGGR